MDLSSQIQQATHVIAAKTTTLPEIGLILGSGLGEMADQIENADYINYADIPNFPVSTVSGHEGRLVIGQLEGKRVIAMQGRFHYYEGYSMQEITFPVRVMQRLGVHSIIITNACGALNGDFEPGNFMFIRDHINLTGDNPLIGPNLEEFGPRFPDMSNAYPEDLIAIGQKVAQKNNINVKTGVHSAVSGPNFLSRAELAMVRKLGADTIGMSTIPETIVAVHSGMMVLGICCVTDMAVPDSLEPIDHDKVMAMAAQSKPDFIRLVSGIVRELEYE